MRANSYHQDRADVPQPPSGCPLHETWSPLDDAYLADPYPIAAALRAEHPVFYAPSLDSIVVCDMADIEAVFADHETFASTNVQDPVFPLAPEAKEILSAADFDPVAVMSNRPEPDHGRIRRYTRQGFSNRRIKSLEPYIRRRSHELIDAMVESGPPAEFVASFAFPLPGETIFRFIGFPTSDDETLKGWCGDRKAFSWGHPTTAQQIEIAENMLAYWRYCRDFTAHKRRHRGDDFASELINAHESNPDDLSYREVESIIYGLSFAGHEAVTALICNTLLCLLPRRDTWDTICAHTPDTQRDRRSASLQLQPDLLASYHHPRHPYRRCRCARGNNRLLELRVSQPAERHLGCPGRLRYLSPQRQPAHFLRKGCPLLPRSETRKVRGAARHRDTR